MTSPWRTIISAWRRFDWMSTKPLTAKSFSAMILASSKVASCLIWERKAANVESHRPCRHVSPKSCRSPQLIEQNVGSPTFAWKGQDYSRELEARNQRTWRLLLRCSMVGTPSILGWVIQTDEWPKHAEILSLTIQTLFRIYNYVPWCQTRANHTPWLKISPMRERKNPFVDMMGGHKLRQNEVEKDHKYMVWPRPLNGTWNRDERMHAFVYARKRLRNLQNEKLFISLNISPGVVEKIHSIFGNKSS